MAVSVYTGVMGSGKTYEAVKNGVIPAIKAGRRVVTNIAGVDSEKIRAYLIERGSKPEDLGHVVHVTNDAVSQPGFFPGEGQTRLRFEVPDWVPLRQLQYYSDEFVMHQGKNFTKTAFQLLLPELKKLQSRNIDLGSCLVAAAHKEWKGFQADWFFDKPAGEAFAEMPDTGPSVVEPGDFVVIDEAWRYWSVNNKLTSEHMNFFRMHRHYIGKDGVACDLLVLIQDFGSLNRFLRGVCELVLIFYKLKVFGFISRYRIEVYEGRPRKATLVSTSPLQKYDKKIFPLYKSYDGHAGTENRTDDRQNLLKNKWFVGSLVAGLLLFIFTGNWFFHYLSRLRNGGTSQAASSQSPPNGALAAGHAVAGTSSALAGPGAGSGPGATPVVDDARLVGVIESSSGETLVMFQLSDGRLVRRRMTAGLIDGWQSVAGYQGRMVSFYFGGKVK